MPRRFKCTLNTCGHEGPSGDFIFARSMGIACNACLRQTYVVAVDGGPKPYDDWTAACGQPQLTDDEKVKMLKATFANMPIFVPRTTLGGLNVLEPIEVE